VLLGLSASLALNSSVNGTQTLALSAGSIAVDAGDSAVNGSVTLPITDQRGLTRTATYDIGAYEYAATAPDVTAPSGTISIDAGNTLSNSTSVTLTLSCTDDTACTQMEISNDNVSWGALTAYATSAPWTIAAGADGLRTVYARFSDAASNVSSVVNDTITLDATPPAAPVISAPANNTVTTSTSRPTISGTAESGASVTIKDGATGLGMVTATGGNWKKKTGGATLTLGAHSFTATATDTAGNPGPASAVTTYTVNSVAPAADLTTPSGTISINAGSVETASTSVTLTLTCTDNVGCAQMQFSNDNTTWGALTSYATTASWSLTAGADGARTVYARFTDAAANVSAVVSDSITLHTSLPEETPAAASGGGGGGCSINPVAGFDPSMLLMTLLSMMYPLRRRLRIEED